MRRPQGKLLITGVSGLLGNNLAYYFKDNYEVLGLYNSHPVIINGILTEQCDLSDQNSIDRIIRTFDPSIIIHCASLTNVDHCEVSQDETREINVLATKRIVDSISGADIKLVYISTDSVYDGGKGNFSEDDDINPLNYYGRSKYEGELEVAKKENSLILRTNIFGWNIQNKQSLGEWVIGELEANHTVNGFKDALFSSIYTLEFARVIDISIQTNLSGIYNCGASDACSKYEFAVMTAEIFGLDSTLISSTAIDDFPFKAKRGRQLDLNTDKLEHALNYRLPTIMQSIESFYRDYRCGLPAHIRNNNALRDNSDTLPYARQHIDENDVRTVVNTLRSERITQGPRVQEFENAMAEYCGAKYAVAVNSGTSALHIACLAAGVGSGGEVITSPNTFVASANCAAYCGARPVFADIDPGTYNITPETVRSNMKDNTDAVIPVHFAGQSCDMEGIRSEVRKKEDTLNKKIHIIEDACHVLGSSYKGQRIGSCEYSDMAVMSFHPVKHITTGEGGVVLTNDEALYKKLKRFSVHGIVNSPDDFLYRDLAFTSINDSEQKHVNPWYYEQTDLGYNYRITDLQCALGLSQLKKLPGFLKRRREIVTMYNSAFSEVKNIKIPTESPDCDTYYHLYVLLFDWDNIGTDRARFMLELKKKGIQTQVHYIPVHTQPYYRKNFATDWGDCPNAEEYYTKCLSIPLFPAMTDDDVHKVIKEISRLAGSS